jgi:hypothetical protein
MAEQAVVFDKAAWHLDAVRERGLPDHQAYVHGGLFFGWAARRGLLQAWVHERTPDAFAALREGRATGPQVFARWDGAVLDDLFTDVGLAFVVEYFDPRSGAYFSDYLGGLAKRAGGDYEVPDDAASADAVDALLDARFAEWRATWEPSAGRPDVRHALEPVDEAVPDVVRAPVLVTGTGVALPGGPLSLRATRPDTVVAVDRALAGDRLVLLVAPAKAGRVVDPRADELLDVGVVAVVDHALTDPERPHSRDVVLQCVHRAHLDEWTAAGGLSARATRIVEPPLGADGEELVEVVRKLASSAVKARAVRGIPPGTLALAAVSRGAGVLDVVARELPLSREERLLVLLSEGLHERGRVVVDALQRELE